MIVFLNYLLLVNYGYLCYLFLKLSKPILNHSIRHAVSILINDLNLKFMYDPTIFLTFGGIICFLIAILHVVIIIVGPSAYRYFGAGEDLTALAEKHSVIPTLVTVFIATILAVFGIYAFSGAGEFRTLPFLGPILIIIGSIFSVRGVALPFQLYTLLTKPHKAETKEIFFSLISLCAGFCFLYGTKMNWDFIFNLL